MNSPPPIFFRYSNRKSNFSDIFISGLTKLKSIAQDIMAPELSKGLWGLLLKSKDSSLNMRPLGSCPTYWCTELAPNSFRHTA